ncbi:MAG: polyphosphate kinase 1 [Erysipelotrichaceae bacterium]|nr:polyphosphate kinase 1 [Erysipelotrichaceae bacterium]
MAKKKKKKIEEVPVFKNSISTEEDLGETITGLKSELYEDIESVPSKKELKRLLRIADEAEDDDDKDEEIRSCFTNRELSWLLFNERVLNEAGNPRVPLAERLTFASIFQTNLDEFFMVRVGTLMVQMSSEENIRDNKTGMSCKKQVKAILKEVKRLEKKRAVIYDQLMGELEPKGIRLINFRKLSYEETGFLETYFDAHIAPFLTPMVLSKQQPFPFLENKQLYAVVSLGSRSSKNSLGIVPCSNSVFKRLIEIPTRPGNYMLSEELILHFVGKIFPHFEIKEKSIMRVTRNADIEGIEVYDEDMNYRDVMEQLIKKRTRLNPVRVEITRKLSKGLLKEIAKNMFIDTSHIIDVDTPLDLSYVSTLRKYLVDKQELFYNPRKPQDSAMVDTSKPIIPQALEKDILLSYPFESMKPFLQLLDEAATDKDVVSIKMTLYRVASQSKIVDTLIKAAENGKEVVVLLELRARFDEENNIDMSRLLEEAGCRILYGLEDYKVHSKLCLISRRIHNAESSVQYITQIGTGNYNEKTATLYTDLALVTANQKIGAEVASVFAHLLQSEVLDKTEELLVSPLCLQNKVLGMMDEQIKRAQKGKEAYIGVKVNSFTDKAILTKMIECSRAGVKVDLVVRGICCLIPGIPGLTENIRVVSIVGRYLEHSRIYIFGKGKGRKIYIASADFMTRNTTRRVEVAAPIHDRKLQNRILHMFDTMMNDDEKGKELTSEGVYVDRHINETPLNSQEVLFDEAYAAAKRAAAHKAKTNGVNK